MSAFGVLVAAKRLDRSNPNWHRSVNPDTLDLSSGQQCVMGQVYRVEARHIPGYTDGFRYAMNHSRVARELREAGVLDDNFGHRQPWIRQINKRVAKDLKAARKAAAKMPKTVQLPEAPVEVVPEMSLEDRTPLGPTVKNTGVLVK